MPHEGKKHFTYFPSENSFAHYPSAETVQLLRGKDHTGHSQLTLSTTAPTQLCWSALRFFSPALIATPALTLPTPCANTGINCLAAAALPPQRCSVFLQRSPAPVQVFSSRNTLESALKSIWEPGFPCINSCGFRRPVPLAAPFQSWDKPLVAAGSDPSLPPWGGDTGWRCSRILSR